MIAAEKPRATRLEDTALSHRHLHAAQVTGNRALQAMALHYGCLAFHNEQHPRFVAAATNRMAGYLGLSQLAQATAEVAAKAHDVVQLKPRGVMERESAGWLAEQLFRRYPKSGIEAGRLAILGTEPIFENGKIIGQMATRLDYPSKEAEQVGLSVACADLGGELYRPLGPYRGHMLYKEMQGVHDPDKAPPLDAFVDFQTGQIAFTAEYRFPHREGDAVLGGLRSEVVRYHEQLAARLQAGTIDSWDQVLTADLAFAREHGDDELQTAML
jgi:hypothetical protein